MLRSRLQISIVVTLLLVLGSAAGAEPSETRAAEIVRLSDLAEDVYDEALHREGTRPGAAEVAAALDAVEAVLRQADLGGIGGDPAVVTARLTFFARWIDRAGWSYAPAEIRLLVDERAGRYAREMLDAEPPPEVWDAVVSEEGVGFRQALTALGLAADPNDPEALVALGRDLYDRRLEVALVRAAADALPPTRPGDPAPRRAALAAWLLQERVAGLLVLGLAHEALDELESAPEGLRSIVLAGSAGIGTIELEVPGPPLQVGPRDLRLDLAAAYALRGGIGDTQAASRLLSSLADLEPVPEPPSGWSREFEDRRSERFRRETLVRFLAASGVSPAAPGLGPDLGSDLGSKRGRDPFEHFVERIGVRDSSPRIDAAIWQRLLAQLAEATGYPELAGYFLADSCRWLQLGLPESAQLDLAPFGGLPDAVLAELDRLEASLRTAAEEIVAETDRLASDRPWVTPLRCRVPGTPSEATTSPVPLPAGADLRLLPGRRPTDWKTPPSHLAARDLLFQLPNDRIPVDRFEHRGELLALALPSDLESSQGGDYALLRSTDGGATWGPPLATGLAVRSPFEVISGSLHNRIAGDRLVVEAVVAWQHEALLDLEQGMRVLLSLPIDGLLSDRDGDGLSDREELEIGTDPKQADSDGDGIDDGRDLLTGRFTAADRDPDAEQALAVVLQEAFFPHDPEGLRPVTEPAERHLPSWRTRFVLGPGMPLGALRSNERLVVVERPPTKPESAIAVILFALDRAGDRALVLTRHPLASDPGFEPIDRYLLERSQETGEWRLTHSVSVGGCVTLFINHELPTLPQDIELRR